MSLILGGAVCPGEGAGRFVAGFGFSPHSNARTNFKTAFRKKKVRVRIVKYDRFSR